MAEGLDPEKFKTAEFKCTCGHGWISIRSLGLPEKCRKCNTRGCKPTLYREATRPEQLQGKKTIMVAKYKCDLCGEKWKSVNSSGTSKLCLVCKKSGIVRFARPYKYRRAKPEELKPKRKFGFFICKCGNVWPSAYTWVGKYQKCRKCGEEVYAHAIQPLKPGSGGRGSQRPHDESRCQKCQELGYSCKLYTPQAGDEDVDFSDDQSVISVASNTSTVFDEDRDDVTPTVSDNEDEYLEDKLENLTIK